MLSSSSLPWRYQRLNLRPPACKAGTLSLSYHVYCSLAAHAPVPPNLPPNAASANTCTHTHKWREREGKQMGKHESFLPSSRGISCYSSRSPLPTKLVQGRIKLLKLTCLLLFPLLTMRTVQTRSPACLFSAL